MGIDEEELTPEERATLTAIRDKKKRLVNVHRLKKGAANNQAVLPRRADAKRTSTTGSLKVGSTHPERRGCVLRTAKCQQPGCAAAARRRQAHLHQRQPQGGCSALFSIHVKVSMSQQRDSDQAVLPRRADARRISTTGKFNVGLVGYAASFLAVIKACIRDAKPVSERLNPTSQAERVGLDPNVALPSARARHLVRSNLPPSVFRC